MRRDGWLALFRALLLPQNMCQNLSWWLMVTRNTQPNHKIIGNVSSQRYFNFTTHSSILQSISKVFNGFLAKSMIYAWFWEYARYTPFKSGWFCCSAIHSSYAKRLKKSALISHAWCETDKSQTKFGKNRGRKSAESRANRSIFHVSI